MNLFNILADEAGGGGDPSTNFSFDLICNDPDLAPMFDIAGTAIFVLLILIPVLLVIFGLIDLSKAVMASKDDEIKASQKLLIKRIMYTIFALLLTALIKGLLLLVEPDSGSGIVTCIDKMFD